MSTRAGEALVAIVVAAAIAACGQGGATVEATVIHAPPSIPSKPSTPETPMRLQPPASEPAAVFVPARVRSFALGNGARVFAYPAAGELAAVTVLLPLPAGPAAAQSSTLAVMSAALTSASQPYDARRTNQVKLDSSAELSAWSDEDRLVVRLRCRADSLRKALDLLALTVSLPSFEEREIDYRKNLRADLLANPSDHPETIANRVLWERMFGPHDPHGQGSNESVADARAVTRDKVAALYDRILDPARMLIAVAGDYDDVELRPALEQTLGVTPMRRKPPAPPSAPMTPPSSGGVVMIDRAGAETTRLRLGVASPPVHGDDEYAALVLSEVLGDRGVGRFGALATRQSLTDSIGAEFRNGPRAAVFWVKANVPPPRAAAALAQIESIIRSVEGDGPSATELAEAKQRLCAEQPSGFERVSEIAWSLVTMAELGDDPGERIQAFCGRIQAVTREGVVRVAGQLFPHERTQIVVMGDVTRTRDSFASAGYVPAEVRNASGK